jgi:hypothetical protein
MRAAILVMLLSSSGGPAQGLFIIVLPNIEDAPVLEIATKLEDLALARCALSGQRTGRKRTKPYITPKQFDELGSNIFRIIVSLGGNMTNNYPFTVFSDAFKASVF